MNRRAIKQDSSRISIGSNDDNEDDICELEHLRKLFIGGLSPSTTEESLRAFYEKWGKVVDCVVMRDTATRKSRGFGFITYTKAAMVDRAQNARPHIIDGKSVEAKRALPRPERENRESSVTVKKVFVGGLKDNHDEDCLREHFSQFGNVVNVKILTDKVSGKRRGFAFIEFDDYDAVDKAIQQKGHSIKYVLVDVKKSVYKQEVEKRTAAAAAGGQAAGGQGQVPPQNPGQYQYQPGPPMNGPPMNGPPMNGPPMNGPPMNGPPMNGPPMNGPPQPPVNYNNWGPPANYNGYNQPPMNNWNQQPQQNGWNGPPQQPQWNQGNYGPPQANWNAGPAPAQPNWNAGPGPAQPNWNAGPPQQQQPNWNAGPAQPQQNWNAGPPQQPQAPPQNFGNGYQQNYGGGPQKSNLSNNVRKNPYNTPTEDSQPKAVPPVNTKRRF